MWLRSTNRGAGRWRHDAVNKSRRARAPVRPVLTSAEIKERNLVLIEDALRARCAPAAGQAWPGRVMSGYLFFFFFFFARMVTFFYLILLRVSNYEILP